MTAPVYITFTRLCEEWGVSRDYLRATMRREDDPLPLFLLPGKKTNPVGRVDEVEAWRLRNQ